MDTELRRGFRLGDRLVAPLRGEIVGPGGPQHVHRKAMEVLLCLAQAPGEIVSRDRILARIGDSAAGAGLALTRCVSELRHHLGDDPHRPAFIETVPGHGYRLLAPVSPYPQDHIPGVAPALPPGRKGAGAPGFIAELRRRKVFRVAVIYAVVAWLVIQISGTTFQPLGIPLWGETLVIVLLLLGFPVAVAMAWALELTPQGLVLDGARSRGAAAAAPGRRIDYLLAGTVVIVLGIIAHYLLSERPVEPPPAAVDAAAAVAPNSIAVMPFVSIGEDAQNAWFADGLAEELLGLLGKLEELKVAARTSSFYFRNKEVGLDEISKRLGVRHILEGSVRRDGNDVRVRAELVDARTGFEVWSDTYDRKLEDIFAMQGEIAQAVVDQLELVLSMESKAQLAKPPTRNVRAYDLYLQARALRRQAIGQAGMDTALEMFNRALAIDPAFAEAHAGICETYLDKYDESHATEHFHAAEKSCRQALSFETTAAAVYTALGQLYLHSGRPGDAEQEFRHAIDKKTDALDAHLGLGEALAAQNSFAEAESAITRAISLEPGYWGGHDALGGFLSSRGRFVEAAESHRRVTELMPDNALAFSALGGALVMQGKFGAAARAFEQSVELSPSFRAYSNTGAMYYYLGRFEESVDFLEKAVQLAPEVHWLSGNLAASYRYAPDQAEKSGAAYRRAIELAHSHLKVNPNDGDAWADLSLYHVNLGEIEQAHETMSRALELAPDSPAVHYYKALLHVAVDEIDSAFAELERAVALGYDPNFLAADPELAHLRRNKRFDALFGSAKSDVTASRQSDSTGELQ